MTEDLYTDLKNSFDEEETRLKNKRFRGAAPNFTAIPWNKWPMPIKYTTTNIASMYSSL